MVVTFDLHKSLIDTTFRSSLDGIAFQIIGLLCLLFDNFLELWLKFIILNSVTFFLNLSELLLTTFFTILRPSYALNTIAPQSVGLLLLLINDLLELWLSVVSKSTMSGVLSLDILDFDVVSLQIYQICVWGFFFLHISDMDVIGL